MVPARAFLMFALVAGVLAPTVAPAQDAPAAEAAAVDGDVAEGLEVAATCEACHGLDGIKKQPDMPNIAGDDASYIVRQLQAYRSGERKHEIMSAIAESLDDDMIADVAVYYSAIEVQAKAPQ